MSVFKAFFSLGKIPQVVKFFEFQSFDDVNKMGGAIRALKEQAKASGTQLTGPQKKYLDDQMKQVEMVFERIREPSEQSGIRSTKSAKIFDLEGKEIDPSKGILGGKQMEPIKQGEAITSENFGRSQFAPELSPQYLELKKKFEKGNKETVNRMKKRKMKEEISKVNDQIEEMIESGVDEMDPKLGKLYDKQNDLELKLDLENMMSPDPEDMATGGRAGFRSGSGKKGIQALLDLFKPKPKPKFDVERFREGPIDLKFLENIDKKDLAPFIRSRDTMGPGGYGMYDDFADLPAGLKAAELIKTIKGPRNEINYKAAELFLGKKLKGNESADELIQMLNRQEMRADGGRAGFRIGSIDKGRKAFLEFMKKFKIKQSGDSVKEFLSKRQFMKDIVGNTEKARKARQLDEIKEAMKNAKGYQFPSGKELRTDIEKTIAPILLKDRKLNSDGGRIGYKVGSVDKMRRLILKAMGAGTAGIAAAKSGIFSGIGKGASKQVAKEVVKKSTSTPPAYFFELAEKIKRLGRTIDGPQERVKIHTMPAKDGKSELMLTEDIGTGEMQIKKIGKEGDEMTTEVQTMEYTPGSSQADETTQGIPGDSYEEYTEFNSRIIKDKFNDSDTIEGINVKEIVEEVKDQAPSIKKAGGGIARMLGE